jgi:DNA-binding GntR family transcriptional regulator
MTHMPFTQLDHSSPIPLYYQISAQLNDAIDAGVYGPGDSIPSELEISDLLNVSRPTVRQAMQQLALKGRVVRRRGIGTIVAPQRIHRPASLSSLYDALDAAGRQPGTQTTRLEVRPALDDVATLLEIEVGANIIAIERLRSAEGLAIALMENYVPLSVLAEIPTKAQLNGQGLYALMRARGIRFHAATQEIGARTITPREAKLLQSSRSDTVLTMDRVARDVEGRTVELGHHVYLARRYTFDMTLAID